MSSTLEFRIEMHSEDAQHGVFTINTPTVPITVKPTFILFTVDATGSMNESSGKSSTKIDVMKHSFANIVRYLSKLDAPIFISVLSFNEVVTTVLEISKITPENVEDVVKSIQSIEADGQTNIELALTSAKEKIDNYLAVHEGHQIAHIFMTDGHPTKGTSNLETLNKLVSTKNCGNVFIGFGNDHNVTLLKGLSENRRSFYQYIQDFESTAAIYGEILHPYLYPCLENAEIAVENGEIYDWTKNEWTCKLEEDILIGGQEKIYHIKAEMDKRITVTVSYQTVTSTERSHVTTNDSTIVDLTQYVFRQKTLELLYQSSRSSIMRDERIKLQKEINALFIKINDYMKSSGKCEDAFLKQLCDDLYIAYSGLKKNNGCDMLSLSRFTSQGRQQTNVSTPRKKDFDNVFCPATPRMSRQLSQFLDDYDGDEAIETCEIDSYSISEQVTSCYATQTVLDTMSQIPS